MTRPGILDVKGAAADCTKQVQNVRLEVLTALKMTVLFFWVVTPCRLIGRYQRFGETYCLHLQG
jgi:hypothetical protein